VIFRTAVKTANKYMDQQSVLFNADIISGSTKGTFFILFKKRCKDLKKWSSDIMKVLE